MNRNDRPQPPHTDRPLAPLPAPIPDAQISPLQIATPAPMSAGIREDDSDWYRIHLLEDPERWDGMS
jgi:hypothetical protein